MWGMKWHNICVVSLQKSKQSERKKSRSGGSESCVLFSGEAFDFMLPLPILKLIMWYILFFGGFFCRLYDEFRRMHKCGWIKVFDFVNVVFRCFGYKPWAVKKNLSCILMYLVVIVDPWAPAHGTWVVTLSINVCVMSFHYPWYIICRMFCSFILCVLSIVEPKNQFLSAG